MPALSRRELYLVTDSRLPELELLRAVESAAGNGADWVVVRAPGWTAKALYTLAGEILAVCHPRGVRVAVSDRLDVALAVGADGAQLGSRSLPVNVARRLAADLHLGVSVHSVEEAVQAEADGADHVTFGHVFETSSHPGESARGLTELGRVVRAVRLPVIAIGGIGPDRVAEVLAAGAAGVAVISAILDSTDPGGIAASLRRALDEYVA